MVNQEIIERLFSLLTQYLNDLKEVQQIVWEEFAKDIRLKRFVERTLQMCIEVALDTGNHIISDEGWPEAKTNRDVFICLNKKKVISNNLLEKLLKMASFRNRIVHEYSEVEPEIVFGILKNNLQDFEAYISEVLQWMNLKGDSEEN